MKIYKDYQTEIKDVDDKGRVLVAANAIGNVDQDKDRSMDGSFNKTMKENFHRLKWFLNHDTSMLIGVPIEGKQKSAYLEMLGQLNLNKQLGRDVYEDYKLYAEYGKTLEHSIGVEAVKFKDNNGVREVFEWKLWEYSTLYGWGANENTPLLGLKASKSIEDNIDILELMLKNGKYSDERFGEIELHLLKLRSLCEEPVNSTYTHKPNEIKVLSDFINSL